MKLAARSSMLALLTFLSGCGASAGSSILPRPTDGDCAAGYDRDDDTTIAFFEIPNAGPYFAAMPGDGWVVQCHPEQGVLRAENERDRMSATVQVFDSEITGTVAEALTQDIETRLARMAEDGTTTVTPVTGMRTLSDDIVMGSYLISREGRAGVMIFAQRGVVLPQRFVRYVINSYPDVPERGGEIIEAIAMAISVFGPVPPEAARTR